MKPDEDEQQTILSLDVIREMQKIEMIPTGSKPDAIEASAKNTEDIPDMGVGWYASPQTES